MPPALVRLAYGDPPKPRVFTFNLDGNRANRLTSVDEQEREMAGRAEAWMVAIVDPELAASFPKHTLSDRMPRLPISGLLNEAQFMTHELFRLHNSDLY